MRIQSGEVFVRSLVLGTATALSIAASVGVYAADLAYPPPIAVPPQYGELAPPAAVPPRVVVVPVPAAPPPYYSAPVPPPVFGPGVVPPAGVAVVPREPCPQLGPCAACGPQGRCTTYPEVYPSRNEPLARQVYPDPNTRSAAPYYSPHAQGAYSSPIAPQPPLINQFSGAAAAWPAPTTAQQPEGPVRYLPRQEPRRER
jgi:hypothetical protein